MSSSEEDKRRMTSFTSQKPELQDWLQDFSNHLKASPSDSDERVNLPEKFAMGFAKVTEIEKGLTYRLVNYQLNSDFTYRREPAEEFYLIIYFYEYRDCNHLMFTINDELIVDTSEDVYSTLLMTNSLVSQELFVANGTYVRGLTLQLSEEWLKNKIAQPNTANYSLFKERNVFQSFLNPKTKKLLAEIFAPSIPSNLPELYLNSRILRLLESFLENILSYGTTEKRLSPSDKDAQNLLRIESYLLENYHEEFPSVDKLARMAFMSPTKLKTLFKEAFGCAMYEYYQKNRMHKAKQFLQSGEYSVSEVGEMLGYQNLSNFSSAFKKEFGFLPKDHDQIS